MLVHSILVMPCHNSAVIWGGLAISGEIIYGFAPNVLSNQSSAYFLNP